MSNKFWSVQITHRGQKVWGVKGDPTWVYEGAILPLTKPESGFKFQVRVVEVIGTDRNHVIAVTEHVRVWGESSRPVNRPQAPMPAAVPKPQEDALF